MTDMISVPKEIDLTPDSKLKFEDTPEYTPSPIEQNIANAIQKYNEQHKNDKISDSMNYGENYEQMLDDILIDANSGKFDNAPIEPTAKADPFKDIINQCFTRDSNGFLVQKEDWKK